LNEITKKELVRLILLSLIVFFTLTATERIFFSAAESPITVGGKEPNIPVDKPTDENKNEAPNTEEPNEEQHDEKQDKPTETDSEKRSEALIKALNAIIGSAKDEIGYKPSGKRKYSGYFDSHPDEWSAEFLSWCIASAEDNIGIQLAGTYFPWTDSVAVCFMWFAVRGCIFSPNEYLPIGGDYVFFDENLDGTVDSVGITIYRKEITVFGTDENIKTERYVDVIRGNMPKSGNVTESEISITSKKIIYFGRIKD